jgi:hypothetical protein
MNISAKIKAAENFEYSAIAHHDMFYLLVTLVILARSASLSLSQ